MITSRVMILVAVLILQDGERYVLVGVAELTGQQVSEDSSNCLRRGFVESTSKSTDNNGIVALGETNGKNSGHLLFFFWEMKSDKI